MGNSNTQLRHQCICMVSALHLAVAAALYAPPQLALAQAAASSQAVREYDIPAGPLADALSAFGTQSGLQVVYAPELAAGKRSRGVSGRHASAEALRRVLAGTGLTFDSLGNATVAIRQAVATPQPQTPAKPDRSETPAQQGEEGPVTELEKMVVTGTRMRGVAPVGSQILQFDREEIERTGAATTEQFIATIPQQFGSVTSNTVQDRTKAFDLGFATAADLRGLGAGRTLVLLNGRRMSANGDGLFADVSMIPLSAVERIDVLLDGASAIYGSDAVGGVINIILRQDYVGATTEMGYGVSAYGDGDEYGASQLLGLGWNGGGGLVNAEYRREHRTYSFNRDFSSGTTDGFSGVPINMVLRPQSERWSVRASAHQSLGEAIEVSADVGKSVRKSLAAIPQGGELFSVYSPKTEYTYGSTGLRGDISDAWNFDLAGQVSSNTVYGNVDFPDGTKAGYINEYAVREVSGSVDGRLFELPAGAVRSVVGGAVRFDELDQEISSGFLAGGLERDRVASLYAETLIPVLGDSTSRGITTSLAGRYDRYQRFGSAFTPKFGIELRSSSELSFRANYNRSFRAPTLLETNEYANGYSIGNVSINGMQFRRLRLTGNNRDLQPERSRNWSLGVDWHPDAMSETTASLTFSRIKYEGRIGRPRIKAFNQELTDPAFADVVLYRDETTDAEFDALVRELIGRTISGVDFTGGACSAAVDPETGICISDINLIDDLRVANIALVDMKNVDASLSIAWPIGNARFVTAFNGTYMLGHKQKITQHALAQDFVDAPLNPPDFRGNLRLAYEGPTFTADMYVRYTDGYGDDFNTPNVYVGSWTTVDLNLRYDFGRHRSAWLRGFSVSANISNLLNQDPPFWPYDFHNVGYDSSNANPMGRFVSVSLRKSF